MRTISAHIFFTFCSIFAGTISGTLIYPGGGFGAYGVAALGPEDIMTLITSDTIDLATILETVPYDFLIMPGEYSIEGDFTDAMPYNVFGLKSTFADSTFMPQSGDPMGLYPEPVYTFGGDAWDIDVELATEGTIGGHITYSGDVSQVKVNVYDIMSGAEVLEGVYLAGAEDYAIVVPSGLKTLEFFADLNGNNTWDISELEPGTRYMGIDTGSWGPIVFAGGGDRFATGVDVILPPSGISGEERTHPKLNLSCSPNPFNQTTSISYITQGDAVLTISDLSGRILEKHRVSGAGRINFGENLHSGTYLITLRGREHLIARKLLLLR